MRIVGGEWRGRNIKAPLGNGVRPTLDRVREAWMSIVQASLPGARVLDLFAGSGALGIEAMSRGARSAEFVDNDPRSLSALRANLEALGAPARATVTRGDAILFTSCLQRDAFDVVFADPPYASAAGVQLAELWMATRFSALIGIEHPRSTSMPAGGDTRRYGDTSVTFYR
ncbi:MAG: 16S rRNA (guanine(966)-N(2))-methyltransferase RsmD [Gemmatimonadota bacterium]|nr:16S rRNA (guanine(966)-N(2))-methyltransferase RsmD [Gemmatimonadota bacterium]